LRTVPADDDAETASVQAFMRSQQRRILQQAINDLSAAPDDDLSAVAHRIAGTVGTYGLRSAYEAVRALQEATSAPMSAAEVSNARATTLVALAAVLEDLPEGGA
jgi:HPt (histidine-containing phosphotransfer) domain-containing protein